MVSKALVVGAYQRKAEEIARRGVELTVLIPPAWGVRQGMQPAEQTHTRGYTLRTIPLRFNGSFHLHYYPTLGKELAALRPDILHMDEEPYNLATWLALRTAARLRMAATFFTWQNLNRRYPPPFAHFEQANYRRARLAIAGSADAAAVLRAKGYAGRIAVVPQFGVDEGMFCRRGAEGKQERSLRAGESAPTGVHPHPMFRVGYAGRLVQEKGVDLLIRACAALDGEWELCLAGEGDQHAALAALATGLGIAARVKFLGRYASSRMPEFYNRLDVLVLPSRTQSNWKEQFGRVLVEAMACEVPVIGSDSGEIPHVIGDAGLIFPDGEVEALAGHLRRLAHDPMLRCQSGARGRQQVLAHYTMGNVAEETVAVYASVLG